MATRLVVGCSRLTSLAFPIARTQLVSKAVPALGTQQVRYAAKKSGSNVKNKIGRTVRKNRGVKAPDGTFVHKGETLVTQFGLRFYPGENVVMDSDWTLKAAYDGVVVVSSEEVNPYPDSPLYEPIQNGYVMHKQFFNVIPTPLHGKFKLVSET